MKRAILASLTALAGVCLLLADPQTSGTATKKTTPGAPANGTGTKATAKPVAETYTKVEDPSEYALDIETELTMLRGNPEDTGPVTGKVKALTVGGKPVDLVTNEIVDSAWVVTKAYGRIKVTGAYSGGLVIWLTPSQRTKIKALYLSGKKQK